MTVLSVIEDISGLNEEEEEAIMEAGAIGKIV
jgi:hypothetical protein